MDSKKVRLLLRAVEAGSMMKIAEEEGYTPSGPTHMMTALERELDVKLLKRSNQGVELTYEGQQLLYFLKKYIEAEDKIRAEIARIKTANDAVIRIGSYPSIAKRWIPEIMREFQELHPGITIELTTMIRPKAYAALEAGKLDIIFVGEDKNSDFKFTLLEEDNYFAVFPPALSQNCVCGEIPLKDLENYPFIMPSYNADTEVQQMLARNNVNPHPLAVVADYQVIINMVSNGLGVSILSDLVLGGNRDDVFAVPIVPRMYRKLGIVTRPLKEMSDVKREFVRFVKQKFL